MLRRELHNLYFAAGLSNRPTIDVRELTWGHTTDIDAILSAITRANYDQPTSPDFVLCCDCLYQPAHYASLAATIVRLGAERTLISWQPRGRTSPSCRRCAIWTLP